MKSLQWTCDGCARQESVEGDLAPTGWCEIEIAILGLASGGSRRLMVDLCPACASKVAERVDPRNWKNVADYAYTAVTQYEPPDQPAEKAVLTIEDEMPF